QDQLGDGERPRRRGILRRGGRGRPPASGQPFGDEPLILGVGLGAVPGAQVVGLALDDDPGQPRSLVVAIRGDARTVGHGGASSAGRGEKSPVPQGSGAAQPTAGWYAYSRSAKGL